MSWLLPIAGLFAALWGMVWGLAAWRRNRDATARIEIPVLGARGAGKTLFMARLAHVLLYRPAWTSEAESGSPRWAVHLPADREERRLRGHALDAVTPGLRGSKAMIASELAAFADAGRSRPTEVPEELFLRVFVKLPQPNAGRVEPLLVTLIEVPGSHFEASEDHEANLYPRLRAARGLVLVVDAARLDPASEADRIAGHYDLYAEVMAQAVALCRRPRFPIWIALTRADLLRGPLAGLSTGPIAPAALDALLPRLAHLPALEEDRLRRRGTLTSALADDGRSAATLAATWGEMLEDLLAGITAERRTHRRRQRFGLAAALSGALLTLYLAAFAWRQWSLARLPEPHAGAHADSAALEEAADAILAHRANPLFFLDQAAMDRRLARLEEQRFRLLGTGREAWWKTFARLDGPADPDQLAPLVAALDAQQARLRAYLDQPLAATTWERREQASRWLRETRAIADWVGQWQDLWDAADAGLVLRLELLPALAVPPGETLGPDAARQVARQALSLAGAALNEAERVSALPAAGRGGAVTGVDALVGPLAAWRAAVAGEVWASLLAVPEGEALLARWQTLLAAAFRRAWDLTAAALARADTPSARAALLRRFEEEQEAMGVPMPPAVAAAWHGAVDELLAAWHPGDDPEVARAEQAFLDWVGPYLTGTGEARLALEELEREARTRIHALVAAPAPSDFDRERPPAPRQEQGAAGTAVSEAAVAHRAPAAGGGRALLDLARWLEARLDEVATLPGAAAAADEIAAWRARAAELAALADPRTYQVRFTRLGCPRKGLDPSHDEGWLDFLNPYLRVTLPGDPVPDQVIDLDAKDPAIEVIWAPWMPVSFGFLDRDGDIDSAEGASDDDVLLSQDDQAPQIGASDGFASLWVLADWEGGGCRLAAEIAPALPAWLGVGGSPPDDNAAGAPTTPQDARAAQPPGESGPTDDVHGRGTAPDIPATDTGGAQPPASSEQTP